MNPEEGLSIPQRNDNQFRGSWLPTTPEMPTLQRSNPIPANRQGNQLGRENWQELKEIYGGLLQETTNYEQMLRNLKPNGLMDLNRGCYSSDIYVAEKGGFHKNIASHTQTSANNLAELLAVNKAAVVASENEVLSKNIHPTYTPIIQNSNSQVGSNWTTSSSTGSSHPNQSCALGSRHRSNGRSLPQFTKDGFPVPYWPGYNLNSPPTSQADAVPSITNSFQFAPVTPDKVKQLETHHCPEKPNSCKDESPSQAKDTRENAPASTRSQAIESHCDEPIYNTQHSSPVAISILLKRKNDSDLEGNQHVEKNKTPQQRTPKRRKHRPKVVEEGKLKRTQKVTIPKNSNSKENSQAKRKYVRKNGLTATDSQQPNVLETIAPENITSRENPPATKNYACTNDLKASDTCWPNVCETTTPDNRNSKESAPGKRKHVYNNGLKSSETRLPNFFSEVTIPNVGSAEKSCRRVLNFNLENEPADEGQDKATSQQAEMHEESRIDSQATEISTRINSCNGIESATQMQQQHTEYVTENRQRGITCNLKHSMNQMFARCIPLQESCAHIAPPAPIKDHNLNVIARHLNMRKSTQCQYSGKNGYTQVHWNIHNEELSKIVFQKNTSHKNLERIGKLMWQSTPGMVMQDAPNSYEQKRHKREYCHTTEHTDSHSRNLNGNRLRNMYRTDYDNSNRSNFVPCIPETNKERKSENGFQSTISSMPHITAVENSSRQMTTKSRNDAYTNCSASVLNSRILNSSNCSASAVNSRILNSYLECDKTSTKLKNFIDCTAGDWHTHAMSAQHNFHKQIFSSEQHLQTERTADKRQSGGFIQENDFITYPTIMTNSNFIASIRTKEAPTSDHLQEIDPCKGKMSAKYTANLISSNPGSRTDEALPPEHTDQQSSMTARDPPNKHKYLIPIDDITHLLKGLNINCMSSRTFGQENALVPYQGDGTIIQYEGGFDPIKRRKPRPKVDLDPETNRIWNLLMGKEGREDGETGGKDKERWWEEQRKVFHGRVDSFIARMHLVQGDRRFTKWKGSVVDSVIGVFLTQNVSDHLSSSAFMSLAARFPLPRTTTDLTCCQSGTSIFIEEPEVIDPDVGISHEKITSQPFQILSCQTSHQLPEHGAVKFTSGTEKTNPTNEQNWRADVLTSQNPFGSFLLQTNGETRSCSGKSVPEDPTTALKPNQIHNSSPSDPLQSEENTVFQEFHSHVTRGSLVNKLSEHEHEQLENTEFNRQIPRLNEVDKLGSKSSFTCLINSNNPHVEVKNVPSSHMATASEAPAIDHFRLPGEESTCYLPSTASGIMKTQSIENIRDKVPNGVQRTQTPTMSSSAFIRNCHTHQLPVPNTAKDQFHVKTHQQERSRAYQLESTLDREPICAAKELAKKQTYTKQQDSTEPKHGGQTFSMEERISLVKSEKYLKNKEVEAKAKEEVSSFHEPFRVGDTNILISEKGRTGGEKSERFDWDSLRKKVQQNGIRKERNKDTMDTLDYEAVRNADAREISNAIKERGMNNMLAARIKDFLNRLVRDHGSIDLEWLRDVPPDKAKDYLLSIRGLGLKSVECVRLLTLHHLAFPVDTNVGRIAVRLGWVPLQPLPESLQLHLLELYPMLESIQKYLWPRLCKLDQRTLYELHYQMITFGKVFCTKNKPNCNACPMRGECRHFASAFASARLALPGSEEKGIVSSSIPALAEKNPAMKMRNNACKEAGFITSKCEPIVEEPASPEPEPTGVSESDTEDAFYEASDEIPTIKLNIEEFTVTLHNYMQENMELQEGDMSKALVALNQEAASIPTPMLKNVSRLRTEHQVYELPDSHPLLKALDEREPDDPSPYLLTIWTPGETADSTQPPQRCESQESGKLCNEKTCFSCNSLREEKSGTVRGTLLIPCRTAMRGSFPLNGTYFQVNEVFADHESSLNPIDVPRAWIWNLPRRTVYFGTSVSTIFRGLSTEGIQYCFWRGFVCVRGFDQTARAPRPLMARLHFPASKLARTKDKNEEALKQ